MTTTTATTTEPDHSPATRLRGDDLRSVHSALRSEWIKSSTVRANHVILALNILGGLAVSWAVGVMVTDEVLYVAEVGFYWTLVASVLAGIGGILLVTSEFQHGTLATALAARPSRWVIALSKTVTALVKGILLGATGLAAGFVGAAASGIPTGDTSGVLATCTWSLAWTSMSAVLGVGIGLIVRHSSGAIAGFLVWGFVVENLLNLFTPPEVARFFPFVAGNHLLDLDSDLDTAETLAVALSRVENGLVFGVYAVLALVVGTVLLHRRDAT